MKWLIIVAVGVAIYFLFFGNGSATLTDANGNAIATDAGGVSTIFAESREPAATGLSLDLGNIAVGASASDVAQQIKTQNIRDGALSVGDVEWYDVYSGAMRRNFALMTAVKGCLYNGPEAYALTHYIDAVRSAQGISASGLFRFINPEKNGPDGIAEIRNGYNILRSAAPARDTSEKKRSRGFFIAGKVYVDTRDCARFSCINFGDSRVYWSPDNDSLIVLNPDSNVNAKLAAAAAMVRGATSRSIFSNVLPRIIGSRNGDVHSASRYYVNAEPATLTDAIPSLTLGGIVGASVGVLGGGNRRIHSAPVDMPGVSVFNAEQYGRLVHAFIQSSEVSGTDARLMRSGQIRWCLDKGAKRIASIQAEVISKLPIVNMSKYI